MDKYEFEQKIKAYIEASGRSQAKTAKLLGHAPDSFNKWVRGVNRMPYDDLYKFCQLVELKEDKRIELFELAGYGVPATSHATLSSHEISHQLENELQAYLDKMQELLLDKNLRKSKPGDEVRDVARLQTLAIIRRLDGVKKGFVVQHLYELDLIREVAIVDLRDAELNRAYLDSVELSKVSLSGADLSGASLRWANLEGANLHNSILIEATMWSTLKKANLRGAILHRANLRAADLCMADLGWTDLFEANLHEANLKGTNLSGADLSETKLDRTNLDGARCNCYTRWPEGFDFVSAGVILEDGDNLGP